MSELKQLEEFDKSYRRIRVGQCPECGEDTRIEPKPRVSKNEQIDNSFTPHTTCEKCYCVFTNDSVQHKLVEHDVYYNLT